ncbi:RNA polymerase sigma factor [Alkalicoccobacillus plakortidis]|uniref:RNA polymerase sigma-70 region 2 domain-containing protein n=1 Tax=Alkalicoccobacillus plakortidis TaxID=444060 RepID=A0ABT0XFD8_9BACI|nr:sigma factor [Alkalicoccobacillus plakortidis]MCM2674602.1 hypothetical protein [Alkalicoccobacillus plakortidis]
MRESKQPICKRIRNKEPEALEQLYVENERALYAFIYRGVKDKVKTEEMIQQLFKRLWQERPKLKDQTYRQWLYISARRQVISHLKETKLQVMHTNHQMLS